MGGQKVKKSSQKVDDNLKEEISKVLTSWFDERQEEDPSRA